MLQRDETSRARNGNDESGQGGVVSFFVLLVAFAYVIINHFCQLYYYSDGPFYLAAIREMARNFPPRSPVIHLEGIPDLHYNLSLFFQAALFKITNNIHLSILFSGAAMTAFFVKGLLLFAGKYVRGRGELPAVLAFALLAWGPHHAIWAGVFSLPGLMINGFYAQTAAYACLFFTLYFAGKKKQNSFTRIAIIFFMFCCLIQHIFTGCLLLLLYALLVTDHLTDTKRNKVTEISWALLIVMTSCLMTFLWPYFSTFKLFLDALKRGAPLLPVMVFICPVYFYLKKFICGIQQRFGTYAQKRMPGVKVAVTGGIVLVIVLQTSFPSYFSYTMLAEDFRTLNPVELFILLSPLFAIVLLGNLTTQNYFLYFWSGFFLALASACWYFNIGGVYWRIFLVSLMPLSVLSGRVLGAGENRIVLGGAVAALLFLLFANIQFLKNVCQFDHYEDLLELAALTPPDATIISDPRSSYLLAGIADRNVIVSFASHWGYPMHKDDKNSRIKDVRMFFQPQSGDVRRQIMDKYAASYVIIAKHKYDFDGSKYAFDKRVVAEIEHVLTLEKKQGIYMLYKYERKGNSSPHWHQN
ncbi:MAG: hypothetical protein KQH63_14310 [Desulfobulbaceae bacterium]|nr:hypothetical protein [Desulfobulbaceae bacterium]